MKKAIILILTILSGHLILASNVMKVGSYEAELFDTVIVSVEIDNDDAFISFQCDILFDETLEYVDGSAFLTNRSNDHILIDATLVPSGIRFISYSNINKEFNDNEGAVLEFKLVTGNGPGNHPLELKNAIIGNADSQNILTETVDGNIYIPSPGIFEHKAFHSFKVYPNPVNSNSKVAFATKETVDVTIQLTELNGRILYTGILGTYIPGFYEIQLGDALPGQKLNSVMMIKLCGLTKDNRTLVSVYKVFVK